MAALMTVFDCSDVLSSLGGNPTTLVDFERCIDGAESPVIGTREFRDTFGYWADDKSVGFGIAQYENIGFTIDYTLTIEETADYEFELDVDDYGDLKIDGQIVCTEIAGSDGSSGTPITLSAGDHTMQMRFQNGTGGYSFYIRWRKTTDASYVSLPYAVVSLTPPVPINSVGSENIPEDWIDRPHRFAIHAYVDNVGMPSRVTVRRRKTEEYIISGNTDSDGFIEFSHLPEQSLSQPYIVIWYDDRVEGFVNAKIYDRIFQVDDLGHAPGT